MKVETKFSIETTQNTLLFGAEVPRLTGYMMKIAKYLSGEHEPALLLRLDENGNYLCTAVKIVYKEECEV